MKIRFSILIVMVAFAAAAFAQNNSLSGFVRYFNNNLTPMHDSTTVYLMQGTTVFMETQVNGNGGYLFENIPAGNYTVKSNSTKKHGGINAVDAVGVLRHFVQMPPLLVGLQKIAADVNGDNTVGSPDALSICQRFVGQIPNFLPPNVVAPGRPDWVSEAFTVQIDAGITYTQDIKMLCTGDVNGSYIPY